MIGLDKRVAGYVADRVEDLLNKNLGKLNEVYESSGKLKVSCSIDVVDKGVPKVTVKIKSKIDELDDSLEGLAIDKQVKMEV